MKPTLNSDATKYRSKRLPKTPEPHNNGRTVARRRLNMIKGHFPISVPSRSIKKDVKIVETRLIKPSSPQPDQPVELHPVDINLDKVVASLTFFYANPSRSTDFMPTNMLYNSLRTTLNAYPVVFGRCERKSTGYTIQPDTRPVHFIVAEAPRVDMNQFNQHGWSIKATRGGWNEHLDDLPPEEQPLVSVRVTRLSNNSGVIVSFSVWHALMDGAGMRHILTAWSENARTRAIPKTTTHDRRYLQLGEQNKPVVGPIEVGHIPDFLRQQPGPKAKLEVYRVPPESVAALKREAQQGLPSTDANGHAQWVGKNDALIAWFFRSLMRARKQTGNQQVRLHLLYNMRTPVSSIPAEYTGNCIGFTSFPWTASNLQAESLGKTASRVRASLSQRNEEHVRRELTRCSYAVNPQLSNSIENEEVRTSSPQDLFWNNWNHLGFYRLDFGYGRPTRVRIMDFLLPSSACFALDTADGGMELFPLIMPSDHERLKNDPEFLKYARVVEGKNKLPATTEIDNSHSVHMHVPM